MACVTKKKSKGNRWCIDFYDQYGKRRLKVLKEGTTKKEARQHLREIEEQVGKGLWMPTKNIPTFSKVAEDWLEHKKANVRGSTLKMYRGHLKHHFSEIDPLQINRITIVTVEKFITDRLEQNMNLTTLRKLIVTFNQTLNYAVRHRYIDYNPVRDAERPRGQGKEEEEQIKILPPADINSLLENVKDQKYKMLFMLAVMSGARQGELFGLKWVDIDWFNNQIHVQRTFNYGTWYKPKTKTSKRKIDIGPTTMDELKKWRKICPKTELDLIFPNEKGLPLDHGNMLRRHFYPALKNADIQKVRFHDLRHTFASLLIEQGENIKYIQSQLGHASPMVTLNVYAHLMKPVNQAAACRLEKTVFHGNGDQMETEAKKEATA